MAPSLEPELDGPLPIRVASRNANDYVRLRLTRLEDRIVFDAAGVVVDLQPGVESAARRTNSV